MFFEELARISVYIIIFQAFSSTYLLKKELATPILIHVRKTFICKVSVICRCQSASSLLRKILEHSCDQLLSDWYFQKSYITVTEVVLIQLSSHAIGSKQKKMKTRNIMAPSYRLKVSCT